MNTLTRCQSVVRAFSARAMSRGVRVSPCSMFQTSPFCIWSRHSGSLSACAATMVSPRVPRTISLSSLKSGHAGWTFAPSERKIRVAPLATRATSSSTGIRPLRSGVHATRQPLTDGALTARVNWRTSTS